MYNVSFFKINETLKKQCYLKMVEIEVMFIVFDTKLCVMLG
jgi:hypothetical protein